MKKKDNTRFTINNVDVFPTNKEKVIKILEKIINDIKKGKKRGSIKGYFQYGIWDLHEEEFFDEQG